MGLQLVFQKLVQVGTSSKKAKKNKFMALPWFTLVIKAK